MFASAFFAPTYFPSRYFPEGAAAASGGYFAGRYFPEAYYPHRYFPHLAFVPPTPPPPPPPPDAGAIGGGGVVSQRKRWRGHGAIWICPTVDATGTIVELPQVFAGEVAAILAPTIKGAGKVQSDRLAQRRRMEGLLLGDEGKLLFGDPWASIEMVEEEAKRRRRR